MAAIAHAATLRSRIPFVHFFDGWRTSSEVSKLERLTDDDLRAMVDDDLVRAHRGRALSPDHPVIRGTAQNPDVYFQGRETANPYYAACPELVQQSMDKFAALTGRSYHLFDYVGSPDAERVVVLMGSGTDTAQETVEALVGTRRKGRRREGSPVPAVLGGSLRQSAARRGEKHRRARPHQGTRRDRRTALHRRGRRRHGGGRPPSGSVCRGTPRHRRALRPGIQGIHPRHGQGGLRRAGQTLAQEPLHGRDQRRRFPLQPGLRPELFGGIRNPPCAASSGGWDPTARWAPTRTRSRSSARRPTISPRGTSPTTPRNPAR